MVVQLTLLLPIHSVLVVVESRVNTVSTHLHNLLRRRKTLVYRMHPRKTNRFLLRLTLLQQSTIIQYFLNTRQLTQLRRRKRIGIRKRMHLLHPLVLPNLSLHRLLNLLLAIQIIHQKQQDHLILLILSNRTQISQIDLKLILHPILLQRIKQLILHRIVLSTSEHMNHHRLPLLLPHQDVRPRNSLLAAGVHNVTI